MEKQSQPFRIAVTGPECSGKTSLTKVLLASLGQSVSGLQEPGPAVLEGLDGAYTKADITRIFEIQSRELDEASESAALVVSDTEFTNLLLWSRYRFGTADAALVNRCRKPHFDLYLLLYPDLPWEAAPYRENPDDRLLLFWAYREWFDAHNFPYRIVTGMGNKRVANTLEIIQQFRRSS